MTHESAVLRRDDQPSIEVSNVGFVAADAKQKRTGIVGFTSFDLNRDIRVEATVRRTTAGVLSLSYPANRDRFGFRHFAIHPIHERARVTIESQVFAELRRQGVEL